MAARTDIGALATISVAISSAALFVVVFARSDQLKLTRGLIRAQETDFAGGVAIRDEEEIGAAAGALNIDAEALVFFLEKENIGKVGAEDVAIQAMRALGDFIFDDVEESKTVGSPGGAGDAFNVEGE